MLNYCKQAVVHLWSCDCELGTLLKPMLGRVTPASTPAFVPWGYATLYARLHLTVGNPRGLISFLVWRNTASGASTSHITFKIKLHTCMHTVQCLVLLQCSRQSSWELFPQRIILYTQPCVKSNRFIIYTTDQTTGFLESESSDTHLNAASFDCLNARRVSPVSHTT